MQNTLAYQLLVTKNGQAGYCKVGSGYPLVLVVGYSGTLYHWNRFFIEKLAQHFTVYMVDNRKIGLSDTKNDYSMAGMAQDIIDFIEALELEKPMVFGWSMGGIVAQTIVKLAPDLVYGLGLLATVPHYSYTNPEFIELLAKSEQLSPEEFRLQLYAMFFSAKPSYELKDFITAAAVKIDDYNYRFNFAAKELQDYSITSWPGMDNHALAEIKVPVLLLKSRNDMVASPEAMKVFTENLANAKLIDYPRGGHFFLHSNPVEVAGDIVNFFKYYKLDEIC